MAIFRQNVKTRNTIVGKNIISITLLETVVYSCYKMADVDGNLLMTLTDLEGQIVTLRRTDASAQAKCVSRRIRL